MRIHIIAVMAAAAALLTACDSGTEPAAKAGPALAPTEAVAIPETTPAAESVSSNAAATPATGEAGLTAFLDKAKVCSDTASEMGDDADQNAQLMKIWAETGCPALEAETAALLQTYAGNAEVTAKIKAAVAPLGY